MDSGTKLKLKEVNNFLEMIYWLYQKELKAGNIAKDKLIPSYGKIYKKRDFINGYKNPTLFKFSK